MHRWLRQTQQYQWQGRSQLHHLLLSPRATTLLVLRRHLTQLHPPLQLQWRSRPLLLHLLLLLPRTTALLAALRGRNRQTL